MLGSVLPREHSIADQAFAHALTEGDERLANLVVADCWSRVLWSSVVIDCSLRRYTGLTSTNPNFLGIGFIHLRLLRKNPF